ncbi:DUF732 domain-containing protein [Gordonia sp. (in: high G+C Gram-positive bacteria)]|uniref:DUF732 domain-containing protein n=1 Tax=Gordonia sp. (in: high G+C Gram-positive bacteria) TaxID=84139 RepID=UPI0039E29B2D
MKKTYVALCTGVAALSLLTACGGRDASAPAVSSTTTVTSPSATTLTAQEEKFLGSLGPLSAYSQEEIDSGQQEFLDEAKAVCSDARSYGVKVAGDNAGAWAEARGDIDQQGRGLAVAAVSHLCPEVAKS